MNKETKLLKKLVIKSICNSGIGTGAIKREWAEPPIEFIIGIGNYHTAYVTMDKEDFEALLNSDE